MRAGLAAALALAVAALGCGDTLVDHGGTDILGDAAACGYGLALCSGVCTSQSVSVCGASCSPCPAPPSNAAEICVPQGPGGHGGACDFECDAGLLRCGNGCCAPALVAAGGNFTCVTSTAGEVHCFGAGDFGQLGDGAMADRTTSAAIPLTGVTALAAGAAHVCAIQGGQTLCWGDRTGFGGSGAALDPEVVPTFAGATAIAAGGAHTCAIVGGAVRCTGPASDGGAVSGLGGALEVAAGAASSCALLDTGGGTRAVKCWGDDTYGQSTGSGVAGAPSPTPVTVPVPPAVQHVAVGARHACASNDSPSAPLYCWGDNSTKQLGDFVEPLLATTVNGRIKKPVVAVAAGGASTCAIVQDATQVLQCWSSDPLVSGGGNPPGEPNDVAFGNPAGPVSIGDRHACFIDTFAPPSRLRCFGTGTRGRLGSGTTADSAPPLGVLDR